MTLKDQVLKEVNDFFQMDQGNRITLYNMNGLAQRVDAIFRESEPTKAEPEETSFERDKVQL